MSIPGAQYLKHIYSFFHHTNLSQPRKIRIYLKYISICWLENISSCFTLSLTPIFQSFYSFLFFNGTVNTLMRVLKGITNPISQFIFFSNPTSQFSNPISSDQMPVLVWLETHFTPSGPSLMEQQELSEGNLFVICKNRNE